MGWLIPNLTIIAYCLCVLRTYAERVSMKIVEEPSSYGNTNYHSDYSPNSDTALKMRIKPSNFSGPPHLYRLYEKCFSLNDVNYKYEFCPFFNVTQHELSLRWNPYKGVLGVYQEWEIENNTFVGMILREGDTCEDKARSVKVVFQCGTDNELLNVTEPHTCAYHMVFRSPLVCHPHAMLVYPTLNDEMRARWDEIETDYVNEEITKKGYDIHLKRLFEEVGYWLSEDARAEIVKQANQKQTQKIQDENGEFQTLGKCTEEYKKLQKQVEGLQTLLALDINNSSNSTAPIPFR